MKTNLLPAVFLVLFLLPSPAAETPLDLLSLPALDGDAAVSYNQWLATSFRSGGEASTYRVESLTVRIDCVVANASVFMGIAGSLNGRPNLEDIRVVFDETALTVPLHSSAAFSLTLEPDPAFGMPVLLPESDYWLVFGVTAPDWDAGQAGGLYHWSYAATGGPFSTAGGWSIGAAVATGNTGGQNWTPENNTPYLFGLAVTPVPEPASLLLILAAGLQLCRRRRSLDH